MYYVPGGKREKGESDQQALIREIKEELAVELTPSTIKYVNTFKAQAHDKAHGVAVKITCYSADFSGEITANAEIEEVTWLDLDDQEKCSPVTKVIMEWLKSESTIKL